MSTALGLQRQAGNRATAALLARGGRTPAVQRLDTGEHAQLGTNEVVNVNGVPFTRSQLLTMGDFYESYDQLKKADPKELRKLKAHIEEQTKFYEGKPGGRDVSQGEWDKDTGGRYLKLAEANDTHFAPGQHSGGKDHKTVWEQNHTRALRIAHGAARAAASGGAGDVPEEAKVVNAFGNHFLTDAFAAGHVFAKADLVRDAKQKFEKLAETDGIYFHQNSFTDLVAATILGDAKGRRLYGYQLKLLSWNSVSKERLSEFLFQLSDKRPAIFYSTFVKAAHDNLNESVKRHGAGLQVSNGRGDTWILAGDTTLNASPDTVRIAREAVAQSDRNLLEAMAFGGVDFAARVPVLLDRVWSFVPRPTAVGQAKVDKVISETADAANPTAARQFAGVTLANLDTLIDSLIAEGYLMKSVPSHSAGPYPAAASGTVPSHSASPYPAASGPR